MKFPEIGDRCYRFDITNGGNEWHFPYEYELYETNVTSVLEGDT